MVNKVRKKDGNLKSPYSVIMTFKEAHEFIEQAKKLSDKHVITKNTYYGMRVWGFAGGNTDYNSLMEFFKSTKIPETKYLIRNSGEMKYLCYNFYVAFAEFDKEV